MNALPISSENSVDSLLGKVLDDFLERQGRGEQPDIEEYAQRYPQIASVLRHMLPPLQWRHGPLPASSGSAEATAPPAYTPGYLGDYRILREIGRGGMGVVYEAEQVSLNRKVALKVLPFVAAMDPKHLQRFKNEAQAAAQLHHQHIVPVYGIGCERGMHYYAMQYIEGPTVAALIHQLAQRRESEPPGTEPASSSALAERSARVVPDTGPIAALPTAHSVGSSAFFRTIAQLGVQAAEALEHAHEFGVIHRDIKPANLLVNARGHLWITDFGLARLRNDMGLTLTGDLLGTLRYMSPEQALAKHALLDHRTDIYSLGATLYELLTLQPTCRGEDRQQVLRQIAREDPAAPRHWNAAIPTDLETIILKALAKEPDGRYASAQELADDLKRFLSNQPIRARRPNILERTSKWSRRHRGVVGTAGVAVLLVLVTIITALVVGIRQVGQERRETDKAHRAAVEEQKKAEKARQAAVEEQKKAEENFRVAKDSYRLARGGLENIVTTVTEDPRFHQGELAGLLRTVRTAQATFYQQFAELKHDDPEFQAERATTLAKLAHVTALLDSLQESLVYYSQARDLAAALHRDHPDVPDYQVLLAKIQVDLGVICRQTARWGEAERAFQDALALGRALAKHRPSAPEYEAGLAAALHNLGLLYALTRRLPQAEAAYQEELPLWKSLVQRHREVPKYQHDLARGYIELATLHMRTRRFAAAEQLLQESVTVLEPLAHAHPKAIAYQAALAAAHNNLCYVYQKTNRLRDAERTLQEALTHKQELVARQPLVTRYRVELAGTQCNLGGLARLRGQLEASLDWLAQSITTLEAVRATEPRDARARQFLATAYQIRFQVLRQMERHAEALHDLDQFLELRKKSPGLEEFRLDRALILGRLQRHTEAAAEAEELLQLHKNEFAWLCKLALVYARAADTAHDPDTPQGEHHATRAVSLLRQAAARGYKNIEAFIKRLSETRGGIGAR